jgi:hypothetical protein
MFFAALSKVD